MCKSSDIFVSDMLAILRVKQITLHQTCNFFKTDIYNWTVNSELLQFG